MSPERERQILALVAEARQRSPGSREAFLRAEVGDDVVALAEAQSLLEVQSRSEPAQSTQTLRGFAPGEIIGQRFRIIRFIARGGMGDVYEAEDTAHTRSRRVALKTIRPEIASNRNIAEQFEREIEFGQTVTHPNVCRIYDLGVHVEKGPGDSAPESRTLFLTMELLNGCTLAEHLRSHGAMEAAAALPVIRQLADALNAAHQVNIMHRDFKPGNVMLEASRTSAGTRAVVTDFGMAMEVSSADGRTVAPAPGGGTPDYMSPEQVRGRLVDQATDIYALGVVVYQMVTARLPFQGENAMVRMVKRLHEPPVDPRQYRPELNAPWAAAILRCLEREPQNRFASTPDFARALEEGGGGDVVEEASTEDARAGPVAQGSRTNQGSRLRTAGSAVLAVMLAAVLWWSRGWVDKWLHPLPAQKRVAVLRFENIGGDASSQALTDGLMQTLASKLTQLEQFQGSLSIVPASEIRKAQVSSAREASREFNATLAITGSVERATPGMLHLIVNLVDARAQTQLRSRDILAPQTDAAAMQAGVVRQVAELLELELRPEAIRRLAQGNTPVPGAYDFYLQGSGYLLAGKAGIDQAMEEFRHALDLDPNYALAYAGLGEAYWDKYLGTKDRSWIDQAWKECQRAIELNPRLAAPHVTLAMLNRGTGRYDQAIAEARRAIAIEPVSDQAYSELAQALAASGRGEEAEATLKQAIALKPNYWNNYLRLGTFYYNSGRYQDAERLYRRVIELVPDNPAGYTNVGGTYHMEGREAEAERMLKQSLQVRHTEKAASNLATVYFFEGRYAAAIPIMEELVASGTKDYIIWGNLGDCYRWTPGNAEKARRAYERAIELTGEALAVNARDVLARSTEALYRAKIGETARALRISQQVLERASDDPDVLFDAGVISEIAGKREAALGFVARAIRAGYSLTEINAEPELRALRGDARYISGTAGAGEPSRKN